MDSAWFISLNFTSKGAFDELRKEDKVRLIVAHRIDKIFGLIENGLEGRVARAHLPLHHTPSRTSFFRVLRSLGFSS